MREDLIIRYLNTSVDRLDLVRRRLQEESNTVKQSKPTTLKEKSTEIRFFELVTDYLETLKTEINLISNVIDIKLNSQTK